MKKTVYALSLAALGLFAQSAMADAVGTYCELTKAQADVQSELLGSAEMFGSVGDPVTGARTLVTGVRKSLSKGQQAGTVDKLAAVQCAAYRLDNKLLEQTSNVEQRSELLALDAMEPTLKKALAQAEANVQQEQAMLVARTARLADVKAAFDAADRLRGDLAVLAQMRSRMQDQVPVTEEPLSSLVAASAAKQGEIAGLTSKMAAQGGWDVGVAAGVRTDLNTNTQEGFVAVTASFSLGKPAADRAAGKVAGLTEKLLSEQRDAGMQSLTRARNTVAGLLDGERLIVSGLEQRKALVVSTLARIEGVDTDEGLRTQRAMLVELLTVEAKLAGSQARLQYLKVWMDRNF